MTDVYDHIFVPVTEKNTKKSKKIRVNFEEILYIEALEDYSKIFIHGKTKPIITSPLSVLEKRLPQNFMRIHRSYIVNLKQVNCIENKVITVGESSVIQVGPSYYKDFLSRLNILQ